MRRAIRDGHVRDDLRSHVKAFPDGGISILPYEGLILTE
jgi:hypothetical protein